MAVPDNDTDTPTPAPGAADSAFDAAVDALPDVTPGRTSDQLGGVPDEVQRVVDALDDRRAKEITVLNLMPVSATLDWFIVATGESGLQLKAMQDSVKEAMKDAGDLPNSVEAPSNRWVLMDYGAVVVHLMSPEAREFYDIEGLWADAERVEVTPS